MVCGVLGTADSPFAIPYPFEKRTVSPRATGNRNRTCNLLRHSHRFITLKTGMYQTRENGPISSESNPVTAPDGPVLYVR